MGAVDSIIGSYDASGLDGSVSFDRIDRFSSSGLEQFVPVDADEPKPSRLDWDEVK